MNDFDQILPVTEVKRDLLALVKRIREERGLVGITRKGKAEAILMGIDEYDGLLETIEILSDPKLVKLLKKSQKELDLGKFVSHDTVWKS